MRETPISWVFLAGDRAYKVKKPVVYPFVDYGSLARRRRYCHEEVRLNRRLAPSLYLGVRSIVPTTEGVRLSAPDDEHAIDYAVEMRRFDEGRTLARAIERGRVRESDIDELGRLLARLHAGALPRRRGVTEVSRVKHMLDESFETLLSRPGSLDTQRIWGAERFASAFLAAHGPAIGRRAAAGRVREGHGDLRAEHVLLGERAIEIVDCVDFDPALREIDVGADLAFLVMDMARLGAPELGRRLLDAYRSAGGDPGRDDFVAFHAAVRAWVRAKIACLQAADTSLPSERRSRAVDEAEALATLGEHLAWRARLPLALVICGPPASGKTHPRRRAGERFRTRPWCASAWRASTPRSRRPPQLRARLHHADLPCPRGKRCLGGRPQRRCHRGRDVRGRRGPAGVSGGLRALRCPNAVRRVPDTARRSDDARAAT